MKFDRAIKYISPKLSEDERIIHHCKPVKGHLFKSSDIFFIPFSLVWCGFVIFIALASTFTSSNTPLEVLLILTLFVLIGLYMVFGRFIHVLYKRSRTFYFITNKKIIRLYKKYISIIDGNDLPTMHMDSFSDGSGTIRFGDRINYRRSGVIIYESSTDSVENKRNLFAIENVPDVAIVKKKIEMMVNHNFEESKGFEYKDEYSFINPYISDTEYILWKGKPEKGHYFTKADIILVPFSIFWSVMVFNFIISTIVDGAPFFVYIFEIPFVLGAFFFLFGRFIIISYNNKRTLYVITNKKIIRLRRKKIDIIDSKNMPVMRVRVNKNGSGTIRFGDEFYYTRHGKLVDGYRGDPWGIGIKLVSLDNVPNVAHVQKIIKQMDKKNKTPTGESLWEQLFLIYYISLRNRFLSSSTLVSFGLPGRQASA